MSVSVIQCPNGHYYDGNKYSACPHCNTAAAAGNTGTGGGFADPGVTVPVTPGFPDDEVTVSYEQAAQEGKTIGIWDIEAEEKKQEQSKDNGFPAAECKEFAPVVGWLVCTEGAERGRDYRLHMGRNFIGRSLSMDVAIPDDPKLSREYHLSIVFDPRSLRFVALPGDTTSSFVNDELLELPTDLRNGDTIKCGSTTLCFIGFCQEGRTW